MRYQNTLIKSDGTVSISSAVDTPYNHTEFFTEEEIEISKGMHPSGIEWIQSKSNRPTEIGRIDVLVINNLQ